MEAKEWQEERRRLDEVRAKLKAEIDRLEPVIAGLSDQTTDMRKRFWEEVTVNANSDEEFLETFYNINQQAALLSERERGQRVLMQKWRGMNRLYPSPYFGRIDFSEDGLNLTEPIYIGAASFVDEDGLTFLVYDWRTPIASMYYDYSPGRAAYDTPAGRIAGTIERKRQYQIQDGELRNVFDASVTIGDELLQRMLAKGADSQMKSIVATIQKEQNAIIRDERSRLLIVQGAAGSGKTSAALQRVAYLLYRNRDTLKADQIVLFSPNPIFNSYVAHVLPELGEENMQQTTLQEYLEYWLGTSLRLEDPFDQIEYVLTAQDSPDYEARLQGIKYKASEAFMNALQQYGEWLGREGLLFNPIRFRDRELITAERMREQFFGFDPTLRLANRVELLQKWLLKELAQLERSERDEDWVDEEMHYLDRDEYAETFGELHKEREVFDFAERYAEIREKVSRKRREDESDFDFAEREEELLKQRIVKASFKPLRQSVKKLAFLDVGGAYARLFEDEAAYREMTKETALPELWPIICRATLEKLGRGELSYEDATPYLYLKELIEGVRTNTDIRHVFIDEGQDYSPFQYEYFKKLFPRARMTVLGDFGQAIFTQSTKLHDSDSPLARLYGEKETTLIRLTRSYRSTQEIVAFTRELLADGAEIVPFERSGPKPLLAGIDVDSRDARILQDVAALKAQGFESIAVITKTAAESRAAYESLQARGGDPLRLVTKETITFEKGAMVIPVYLAKGVEFDAVLIYDASERSYGRESDRKLLYTACTRAMHHLTLYAAGEWSPFVRAVDAERYENAPK